LFGHPLKIESDSAAVDFAAQSGVQQRRTVYNELEGLATPNGFAPS